MAEVDDVKHITSDYSDQKESQSSADELDSPAVDDSKPLSIKLDKKSPSFDMPLTPTTPHTPGTAPPGKLPVKNPPQLITQQNTNNHKVPSPGSSGSSGTPQYLSPGHGSPDPVHDLPPELLQAGWRRFWSRREARPYFFNKITHESLWEMPPMPGQTDPLTNPLGIGEPTTPVVDSAQRSLSIEVPGRKRSLSDDGAMLSPNKKPAFTFRSVDLLLIL